MKEMPVREKGRAEVVLHACVGGEAVGEFGPVDFSEYKGI
jgi:hypothetical protein